MAISAYTISKFAPWGNAELAFTIPTGLTTTDPETGNKKQNTTETLNYLVHMKIDPPQWKADAGADTATYMCTGRLLSPATMDFRLTNGSQAEATINGFKGRFELIMDLSKNDANYTDIRQSIRGTFRVIGGPA